MFWLAGSGCGEGWGASGESEGAADAGVEIQAIPVEVEASRKGRVSQTILATATVAARREVLVLSETRGLAREVGVEEGDAVQKGALLARLVNADLELSVPMAGSTVSRLKREVENLKPLVEKGYVSRQSYEELKHQLTLAQDQLTRARTQVDALRIKAPLDGVVARRSVVIGQQVNPGQELFHLVDPSQLEVVINVPERSLGQIGEGEPAYAISEALGPQRFVGQIRLINPVVNPQTGTIKVTIALDRASGEGPRLRPGMFVSVHLITDVREDATLVPKRALVYKDDKPFVFVAEGPDEARKAAMRPVVVGFGEDSAVEIVEGLEAGEEVVVLGQSGLKDGAEIRVVR